MLCHKNVEQHRGVQQKTLISHNTYKQPSSAWELSSLIVIHTCTSLIHCAFFFVTHHSSSPYMSIHVILNLTNLAETSGVSRIPEK